MARIRSIKPEFWGDRKLARVSRDARLLYIALWNLADEHSRVQGDPRWVNGHCFPYDDDIGDGIVDKLLDELADLGRVQRYEVDDDPFLYLPKLAEHQRLEPGKSTSRLPEPPPIPDNPEPVAAPTTVVPESAQIFPDESAQIVAQQVAGSRGHVASGREQGAGQTQPSASSGTRKNGARLPDDWQPSPELIDWAKTECPHVDGRTEVEKFRNHWHAKTGRDATKLDWGATFRNWMLNARDRYGPAPRSGTARASPANGNRPSTADQRVSDGLAVAARLQAQETP